MPPNPSFTNPIGRALTNKIEKSRKKGAVIKNTVPKTIIKRT